MHLPDKMIHLLGFPAFLLFFAGMWCLALFVTAVTGGWRQLGRKYATQRSGTREGETFRMASATLGRGLLPANYNSCMAVNFGRKGIYLSPWIIFRFSHPPLLIPWRAVKNIAEEKFWLRNGAKIEIRDFEGTIRLYGRPGAEAIKAFAKFRQ
jgi:hypothetical protein